jgi:hypothetical protein
MNTEQYNFYHVSAHGLNINLSFTVPTDGTRIGTFHSMCRKFALALGYAEKSVEEYFGPEDDESFVEFVDE